MSLAATLKQPQMRVLGVVSSGHFMSHFYGMTLPPLYPFLHDSLGISYTFLGGLLSMQYILGSGMQFPAGMVVDRFGAKNMLMFGLLACALAMGIIGLTGSVPVLIAMIVLYAIGNSVFHPADYSILNGTMDESYMGRSFSLHTFFGETGTALAPTVMLTVAFVWGWQAALLVSACLGFVVLISFVLQLGVMKDDVIGAQPRGKKKKAEGAASSDAHMTNWQVILYILASPPILYLFMFFCVGQLASGGLKSFSVSGLVSLYDTPVQAAGTALSAFLFASAFGILIGGYVADKTKRHDLYAAGGLLAASVVMWLVGSIDFSLWVLVAIFTFAGVANGMVRPARDMMIRNAAPKGATGKVFGFVFSGQSLGGGIAPVVFGIFIDMGKPAWIFYTSAVFLTVCATVMLLSGRASRSREAEQVAEAAE